MAGVALDLNSPMGYASCVAGGECMVSCPTGALTNKRVVATDLQHGEPVEVEYLKQLPFFQKVSGTFLELNRNAVVLRRFRAGEIICREGEYGSTAFYILEGTASVYLSSPMAHIKTEGGATGFLSKLTSRLVRRQQQAGGNNSGRTIPIDAPLGLPLSNPV